ncbi:MAG: hypothetical protein MJZ14_01325 [Paludibacteraceae bacterium]|nr:hypothetical protein [Paludibacteraceae bacterium]
MEDYDSIEERILAVSEGEVVRERPCLRVPLMVGAWGMLLLVLMSDRLALIPAVPLRTIIFYVGWGLVVCGLVLLRRCTPHLYERSSGEPMTQYELEFDAKRMGEVMNYYESGDYEALVRCCVKSNGGLRLTIVSSSDGMLSFTQMSKFVPYTYEPIENVRVWRGCASWKKVMLSYGKKV